MFANIFNILMEQTPFLLVRAVFAILQALFVSVIYQDELFNRNVILI